MAASLVYLKLELKRAWKKLPHIYAGAIVLICLSGAIAFLSGRTLYANPLAGRIAVGVVLPRQDAVAEKVVSMISSLESVKSLCDFSYSDRETALERMQKKEIYAIMEIPEGFVRGIMDGTNTPVQIWLPERGGVESRIFKELTNAGARTLSASQAGIYAGDELCTLYGLEYAIPQLEKDLNRMYLGNSLSRLDIFRHREVSAAQDVGIPVFYGCSAMVLFLLFCGIPVCTYLMPVRGIMKQKLSMLGVGAVTRIMARSLGMGCLLAAAAAPVFAVAWIQGLIKPDLLSLFMGLLVCLSVASVSVLVFQLAGSLMGGVMALFLLGIAQHYLAGGFLPPVFLPETVRRVGVLMPSSVWMEAMKAMVTGNWGFSVLIPVLVVTMLGAGIAAVMEVRR